jgi:hypothetical protein
VRWRPEEGVGLEHLSLLPTDTGILARGVVIGSRGGSPYGASYRVICDGNWRTREFHVDAADGRRAMLFSDGVGHWTNEEGEGRPEFDGCIDVDLAASPFTNTLPIRRLSLARSEQSQVLNMVYVPFDTLVPVPDHQIYTCLEPCALYAYQAADRTFEARLRTDEDGIVLDYPTLFRRVPLAVGQDS